MGSKTNNQARREAARLLEETRAAHARMLEKVEKVRVKFEKRRRKLQALEARLAELEQARSAGSPEENGKLEAERHGQATAGDDSLRRVRLIFNPRSGQAAQNPAELQDIVTSLRSHGILAEVTLKTSGRAARELATEAVERGEPLVIVAGGDGTVAEVAVQLIGSKTALGIIPGGTRNNLARSLGVPLKLDDACALLGMSPTRRIDIGRATTDAEQQPHYFMETGGVGLSGIALPAGQDVEKGRWSELPKAVRHLLHFDLQHFTIELDGGQLIETHSQIVTVSNAPLTANNMLIAPEAKMDDGLYDVAVYPEMGKPDLLGYFLAAMNGGHATNDKVQFHRSRRVIIRAPHHVCGHTDKDPLAEAREFTFEILPQALYVVAGQGIGLTVPVEAAPAAPPLSGPQPAG